MEREHGRITPTHCPACAGELVITRLECPACGTAVSGTFTLGRLATLREPHASLLTLFLRVRGNVKEMERILGLSYPTVRARLDEAFAAAGLERDGSASGAAAMGLTATGGSSSGAEEALERAAILDALERGEITAAEAAAALREQHSRSRRTT